MPEEQDLNQKYLELQLLNQQLQQLQEQQTLLEQQRTELLTISKSLDDLDTVKKDSRMYAPLGGGLYVEGIITETKKVLTNVGANVLLPKPSIETKQLVEEQVEQLIVLMQSMEQKMKEMMRKAEQLQGEIRVQSQAAAKKTV